MHGSQGRPLAGPLVLVCVVSLVAACVGGAASPAPASPAPPSPPPAATPSPAASSSPAGAGYVVRASLTQALPPRDLFGKIPLSVVTADGRLLTPGPVREIYPGPLVAPILERSIGQGGVAALLQAARDLGILRPGGDFTGGALPPGAAAGRLQVVADGVTYDLVGDMNAVVTCAPSQSCPPPVPGTPAAFATFWDRLLDASSWLAPEPGGERPYAPTAYAVIVGPAPEAWAGATPVVWPVAEPALGAFGRPLRGESGTRCGTADGDLASALRPLFGQATQLTPFVATASASSTHGLTVRPLLPGDDDPCAGIVE